MNKHQKYLILAVLISIPAGMMDNILYGIFIAPFISELNQELDSTPHLEVNNLYQPIVEIGVVHDQFIIELVGPDGNLKDVRTTG